MLVAWAGGGCLAPDRQAEPDRSAAPSPRQSRSDTAQAEPADPTTEPRAVAEPSSVGRPGAVLATPEDELLVQLGRHRYRVLRPGGQKLSPVMRLDADFDVGVGFTGGFVISSYAEDAQDPEAEGDYHVQHVDLRGRVHPTSWSSRVEVLRSGDVTFRSMERDETLAYRPSTRTAFRFPTPVKKHLWQRDERGWVWSCPNRGASRGTVWWSSDGARTWHRTVYRLLT